MSLTSNSLVHGRDLPDFRTFVKSGTSVTLGSPLTISGTNPTLIFDDTDAGDDNYALSAQADVFSIRNDDGNGTVLLLEDENGEDYSFTVDSNNLVIRNTTGPVDFITLAGGASDNITIHRATTITGLTTIQGTNPLLSFDDTDGDGYQLSTTGTELNLVNDAGNATILRLSDNGGGDDFSLKSDANIFTITDIDQSKTWEFKGTGFLRHHSRCTHLDAATTGNVGTGLDTLRSISIVAATLATDGDFFEVYFGGFFASNDDDKRLFCSFGGTTVFDTTLVDFDGGDWYVHMTFIRVGSTTVRVVGFALQQSLNNLGGAAGGNGAVGAVNIDVAVSNLTSNANTLLLQGESATATNDNVVCNLSKIEVNQLT